MLYDLHITLTGIHPPIWRLLRVPGSITLTQLHHVLNSAKGWTNSHLHEFQAHGIKYTDPETVAESRAVAKAGFSQKSITKTERGMTLDALELILWDKFIYLYDFGDNWVHEVEVKSIQPDEAGEAKVMLLGGARACPPEDCGGVGGYDDMLLVLRDPKHPEHQEFLDWLGGSYDPDAFSKQKIEQALKKIKIRK